MIGIAVIVIILFGLLYFKPEVWFLEKVNVEVMLLIGVLGELVETNVILNVILSKVKKKVEVEEE